MTGSPESEAFQEGLLEIRNTPTRHGTLSPAQLVFGRPMRSRLPSHNLTFDKIGRSVLTNMI
ncbi:Putative LOC101070636 [Caligus rogercresseyi]|uniref:LOC101070636 n=1 Tax=Caligus rogercresseyi TaxID=217165 RepID=A0A7T8GYX7_CALRO|nr:Putative LOC101070636 [Caligus rogercresseyi]